MALIPSFINYCAESPGWRIIEKNPCIPIHFAAPAKFYF